MFKSSMIGNLVADPEIKYTPKGSAKAEIRLACDTGKDKTTFVDVVMWEKDAELAAQYLKKGRKVYMDCRVHMDEWEDKETGKKKSKLIHTCEYMKFLSNSNKEEALSGN